MIPLTRQDVLAHQTQVPWPDLRQVEQDLLLSRSIVALFGDPFLRGQIAMRGGTVLHKVHLAPASRYSEDIDLVVVGDRPETHVRAAIKRVLADVLGAPVRRALEAIRLAVRNAARPSRILRLTWQIDSVADSRHALNVVVEANVSERTPFRPVVDMQFGVNFRNASLDTVVRSFDIHEMLGTKMRALFQRYRGRDLFDLYWALREPGGAHIDPREVIESFLYYMRLEGTPVSRRAFLKELDLRLADAGFCADMNSLLRTGLTYDPQQAGKVIRERLIARLPE
ncbi:MAG: nucleotidyl transferase AbiEii/AbiGii toxin family protein [Planctomycetota bacterium]